MPKNRYTAKIGTSYVSDNLQELEIVDVLRQPATLKCTLGGIETSDWTQIKKDAVFLLYYYDSAGTESASPAFTGIVKNAKYITQKSVELQVDDYHIKLKREPLTENNQVGRFYFSRENCTLGTLVNILCSQNLDGASPFIVTVGTVDNSSTVIGKFEAFLSDRWTALQNLATQTNSYCYLDKTGVLQFLTRRGADTEDSGTSSAVGTGTLTDGSKSWATNTWTGYILRDSASSDFLVFSNTGTVLTVDGNPAAGTYSLIRGYYDTGGYKNAFFGDREYNDENIWNDVQIVGSNGVSARYMDISTAAAYTTQSDTRLSKSFNTSVDTVMYVEGMTGIPNEAGVVLLLGGSPVPFTNLVISKYNAYFRYTGTSGNTLTGLGTVFKPNLAGDGIFPAGTKVQFINKIRVDATSAFDATGDILIGTEVIPYKNKDSTSFYCGEAGSGTGGVNTFTDGTKSWQTNAWANYVLVDSANATFAIASNTGTVLTVTGTPANGVYMIVPGQSGVVKYFRQKTVSTTLTAATNQTATTLPVASTTGFDNSGMLYGFSNTGQTEVMSYTSKDATNFLGVSRGLLKTQPAYLSTGNAISQYYESGIHPNKVRVQKYPAGGVAEANSSIDTHGRRFLPLSIKESVSVETIEQLASRILLNHRFGDQYISFVSYAPQDYNRVDIGDLVELTDSSLTLDKYSNNVTQKKFYFNMATGETYTRIWMGNQPVSETDKFLRRLAASFGGTPNNQQYISGDTPKELLVIQCGAPGVRLNGQGLDVSNENSNGFVITNNVWIQAYSASGPSYKGDPFDCYGVAIDTGGIFRAPEIDLIYSGGYYTAFAMVGATAITVYNSLVPYAGTYTLGSSTTHWQMAYIDSVITNGIRFYFSGTHYNAFDMRNATTLQAYVNLIPNATDTYSLGSSGYSWDNSYIRLLNLTVATGTAPLIVSSTTKVSNLNVDAVDGCHVENSATGILSAVSANYDLADTFHLEPANMTNSSGLGSSSYRFNSGYFTNIYCTNKNASNYITGHIHEEIAIKETVEDGDVVEWCPDGQIRKTSSENSKFIFGVADTDMRNVVTVEWIEKDDIKCAGKKTSEAKVTPAEYPRPVILGIYKIKVFGDVKIGDYLCSSKIVGVTHAVEKPEFGTVIAQALGSHSGTGIAVIKAMIRKM